jgi:hypothetical protein
MKVFAILPITINHLKTFLIKKIYFGIQYFSVIFVKNQ